MKNGDEKKLAAVIAKAAKAAAEKQTNKLREDVNLRLDTLEIIVDELLKSHPTRHH